MIQGLLILIALFLFIAFIWGVKSVVAAIVSALGGEARPQAAAQPKPLHAHRREALDALKEAHALFERGVLTRDELERLKRELLA